MAASKLFALLLLLQSILPSACFSTNNNAGSTAKRVFISTPAKSPIRIVADCMTSDPFVLSPQTSVDEAIARLLAVGVSGAPVVERLKNADADVTEVSNGSGGKEKVNYRLVGFVSSFDFLPREESGLVPIGDLEDSETARRILGQRVKDIMTKNPVTVGTNDLMKTAAEIMAKNR